MAAKEEKHISPACEYFLLLRVPERSLSDFTFPDGFWIAFNQKHWINETKTIGLIEDLLVPFIKIVREGKALPQSRNSLLLWDALKVQSTPKVMDTLSSYNIESVMVPKNMTHLLQPLDLTTNGYFKKYEKRAFSEYFTSCIMKALTHDPDQDITTIKVGPCLSTLKPLHAKLMTDMYQQLKSEKGKEIIKAG